MNLRVHDRDDAVKACRYTPHGIGLETHPPNVTSMPSA